VKLRVSVVLIRGDEILLIRHRRDARFYWVLPGGGLEPGEALTACAVREVREETGLDVRVRRLLYVSEASSPTRKKHVLDLIFLGEMMEVGQPIRLSRHWTIEEPRFIPLPDLLSIELYPPIALEIVEDAAAGWRGPTRFLGNLWVDVDLEETASRREQARDSPPPSRNSSVVEP
jgi:ADP-ribose pyrophosphatase YjhB (NUDIX family)